MSVQYNVFSTSRTLYKTVITAFIFHIQLKQFEFSFQPSTCEIEEFIRILLKLVAEFTLHEIQSLVKQMQYFWCLLRRLSKFHSIVIVMLY